MSWKNLKESIKKNKTGVIVGAIIGFLWQPLLGPVSALLGAIAGGYIESRLPNKMKK